MTPEWAAAVVARWVRWYTRHLPTMVAQRRVEEVAADVHEQVAAERADGTNDARIALSIVSRMARGIPADLSWRRQAQTTGGSFVKPFVALIVAGIGVAAVALVTDSWLLLLGSVALIVAAGFSVFVSGVKAAWHGRFMLPYVVVLTGAMAVAGLAVSSIVIGMRGDAPGLVLLGSVLIAAVIVGVFSFGLRTARDR